MSLKRISDEVAAINANKSVCAGTFNPRDIISATDDHGLRRVLLVVDEISDRGQRINAILRLMMILGCYLIVGAWRELFQNPEEFDEAYAAFKEYQSKSNRCPNCFWCSPEVWCVKCFNPP